MKYFFTFIISLTIISNFFGQVIIGIGATAPQSNLDVHGTILIGAEYSTTHISSLNGNEAIIIPGVYSDYLINVQDGNGRIQHKWNATYGTNETFLVNNDDAFFMDITAQVSSNTQAYFELKHADGLLKNAGDAIEWNTHFGITQGGQVGIGATSPTHRLQIKGGNLGLEGNQSFIIGGNNTDIPAIVPEAQLVLDGANNGVAALRTKLLIRGIDNETDVKSINVEDEDGNNLFYISSDQNSNGKSYFKGTVGVGTEVTTQKLDINGRIYVSKGTIQKGGSPITTTTDLGLYNQVQNENIRFVTNNGEINFYSDDGHGTSRNVFIGTSGVLNAIKGLKTERQYRQFRKYHTSYSNSSVISGLGNWDFCSLSGIMSQTDVDVYNDWSNSSWVDGITCSVRTSNLFYEEWSNEGPTYHVESPNYKIDWELFVTAYGKHGGGTNIAYKYSTCIATCVNFQY